MVKEMDAFNFDGVDGILVVTPYYNKPTQEGLYLHHKRIAESVDIPQVLYNVPGRTVCDLLPETVARLAEIPNIIGIKEATGSMQRLQAIQSLVPADFGLFSGDDATGTEFMLQGGHGVISVTSNVAPDQMAAMCVAALAADREQALELNRPLEDLHNVLFVESNPIPVKWALFEMGLIPEGIRLPLTPLSGQFHEALRQALRRAGVLS
jgi:4-hydroxy-tetrahydrodipicolinate synthase